MIATVIGYHGTMDADSTPSARAHVLRSSNLGGDWTPVPEFPAKPEHGFVAIGNMEYKHREAILARCTDPALAVPRDYVRRVRTGLSLWYGTQSDYALWCALIASVARDLLPIATGEERIDLAWWLWNASTEPADVKRVDDARGVWICLADDRGEAS